jgi:hypothetical protein
LKGGKIVNEKSESFFYLKGQCIQAKYAEQIVPENQGNPLIEAIPNRLTSDELYNALYSAPRFNGSIHSLDDEERLELIQQIKPSYWLPMEMHFLRYRNLYTMLKIGYQSRNPTTAMYHRQMALGLDQIFEAGTDSDGANLAGNIQTAQQCAEIGLSGLGKSKSYDKLLQLIPQVILHTEYKGKLFPCKQVTWLKIECPSNKSVGALCRNFYAAVDDLLGTNYYKDVAEKSRNIEVMAKQMSKVAGLINLGVLVIDEIQRINRAQSGGDNKMIDFITELTNSIGIPIIIIGTFKAMYLFRTCLANCRRGIPDGYSENISDRMSDDWEWNEFIENLWELQYTKNRTKLTSEIKAAMYYHTIGIPDFAVKLFMHVQSYAILSSDDEIMTVEMIEEVANRTLRLVEPIFERIRKGEDVDPEEFEDLKPDWVSFNRYLMEAKNRIHLDGNLSEDHKRILAQRNRQIQFEEMVRFAAKMGCSNEKAEEIAAQIEKELPQCDDRELLFLEIAKLVLNEKQEQKDESNEKNNVSRAPVSKRKGEYEEGDLREIIKTGRKNGRSTDEALREGGYVGTFDEFLTIREA